MGLAYFPLFFFLSCVSPIKTKRAGRPNIFTDMKPLKTFYIHCIALARRIKRFTLFLCEIDYLYPPIFWSMIIM